MLLSSSGKSRCGEVVELPRHSSQIPQNDRYRNSVHIVPPYIDHCYRDW